MSFNLIEIDRGPDERLSKALLGLVLHHDRMKTRHRRPGSPGGWTGSLSGMRIGADGWTGGVA